MTKLYVSKLDENTREPVTGAVLQIIEKSTGTVAYQWTSGTAAQAIERVLNVDTVYILREVTAPEGYDKAEDTEFSFDAYGNLTVHSGRTLSGSAIRRSTSTIPSATSRSPNR